MTDAIDPNHLTPEQQDALDDYGELIAQGESSQWDLGNLTSSLSKKWTDGGTKAFYNAVVKAMYSDRAPQYGTVMLYRRVAETWKKVFAINVGMSKLAKVWSYCWAHGWDPKQTHLDEVEIQFADPKTGRPTTRKILDATETEIQDAINELNADGDSADLNHWPVVALTQKTLETYKKGGSHLLVTKEVLSKNSIALGLRPIFVDDFPSVLQSLTRAFQNDGLLSDADFKT
jgi:hypothetical protein